MKLLFVDCCISQRGEGSRTKRLAKAYLDAFLKAHPGTEVERVSPETLLALRPLTRHAGRRDALAAENAGTRRYRLGRQLRGADAVMVAAPYWDLSYPAALRTYIEYVSANGLTYHYEADGCHGDCQAERLVYLTTGGDIEREDSVGVAHWRAAFRHVRHRSVRLCVCRRAGHRARAGGGAA